MAPVSPPVTVAQIDQHVKNTVPRCLRRAESAGARDAVCALESVQARRRREEQEARDAAVVAAEYAQVEAQRESARAAALEEAIVKESDRPPLTKDEWQVEVLTGLAPAIQYVFEWINPGGDRHDIMEFFRGARIFDPSHAKTLNGKEAFDLIDKMSRYPIYREGG